MRFDVFVDAGSQRRATLARPLMGVPMSPVDFLKKRQCRLCVPDVYLSPYHMSNSRNAHVACHPFSKSNVVVTRVHVALLILRNANVALSILRDKNHITTSPFPPRGRRSVSQDTISLEWSLAIICLRDYSKEHLNGRTPLR